MDKILLMRQDKINLKTTKYDVAGLHAIFGCAGLKK
jgi:hypothetical protein